MNRGYVIKLFCVVAILFFITRCDCNKNETKSVLVYSGAAMKEPMNEIALEFEKEFRIKVNYIFGGSGTILAKIEMQRVGDIFMPASEFHMNMAKEKGYIDATKTVAIHTPVIFVAKGNPKKINSLQDLQKPDIRISFGIEEACAICNLTPEILQKNGISEITENKAVTTSRTTVNELALDVILGEADATIIWRSTALNYVLQNKADIVEIEEQLNIKKTIPVAVLNFSENKRIAEKFIEYTISKKDIWKKYGYEDVE